MFVEWSLPSESGYYERFQMQYTGRFYRSPCSLIFLSFRNKHDILVDIFLEKSCIPLWFYLLQMTHNFRSFILPKTSLNTLMINLII